MFELLMGLFPVLQPHRVAIWATICILSVSFFTFSVISYYWENILTRLGYIISSSWLIFVLYFLMAAFLALVLSLVFAFPLWELGYPVFIVSLGLTLYGLVNARIPRVTSVQVKLPNLPEFWRGKTAVMVSDLHLGHVLRAGSSRKIVKKINILKPEIVFIPGDFYDGVKTDFQVLADPFKNITAPLGIYYCSGNHEMYAGYEKCERALKQAAIKILEDAKTEVQGLQILGLAYKSETDHSVKERLAAMNIDANKPSLLLKHIPSHLGAVEQAGVSFQLSGHTHLAQVWPFMYIPRKLFKGYDYGFKPFGKLQIYTSCGAGTWGPPLRVFTKSEIVKITFQPLNDR